MKFAAFILASLLLGAIIPLYSAEPAEELPYPMPVLSKEEYTSLGLVQTYLEVNYTTSLSIPGRNVEGIGMAQYLEKCPRSEKYGNGYWTIIKVVIQYYPGNASETYFLQNREFLPTQLEDREYKEPDREESTTYEILASSDRVFGYRMVWTYRNFDNQGKLLNGLKAVYLNYWILGGPKKRYLIYVYATYQAEVYGISTEYADQIEGCDVEPILPRLMEMYLSKIPGSDVEGRDLGLAEPSETATQTTSKVTSTSTGGKTVSTPQAAGKRMKPRSFVLDGKAKSRMDETLKRLSSLSGGNVEIERIKTPEGEIIKVVDGTVAGGSALKFKLKYYGNKYVLDKVVDGSLNKLNDLIGEYLPGVNLWKDYVKAYKDSELFQGEETTAKTMKDLHVSKRAAENYNEMSGIEGRELKLSPYKNAVPTGILTKPIESTLQVLGVAVKKAVAQNYEWEFKKTAERALFYKKLGMKYRDIILRTIADVEEETSASHRVQTLNAQSKGDYRDQEARIRLYIQKLFEEGRI